MCVLAFNVCYVKADAGAKRHLNATPAVLKVTHFASCTCRNVNLKQKSLGTLHVLICSVIDRDVGQGRLKRQVL